MYIGVKSDLFQLGMVLWALAAEDDEPERKSRPLQLYSERDNVPHYFCDLTARCLSLQPKHRLTARDLLEFFPDLSTEASEALLTGEDELFGISGGQDPRAVLHSCHDSECDAGSIRDGYLSHEQPFHRRRSIDMPFDGPGSYMVSRRGRTPPMNTSHLSLSDRARSSSQERSDDCEPNIVPVSPTHQHNQWEHFDLDGTPYLVQRDSLHFDDFGGQPTTAAATVFNREFRHVDSGLADMDLAGVGGHAALREDLSEKVNGTSLAGAAEEMGFESHDSHGIMDDMNRALGV